MWELDHKESWVPKNWCFWTVVLEKTLESPLDWKEIQPVHPKGDQSWVFIGRTDTEAETPILWPPHAKNWLIWKDPDAGKDWGQEEKGTTEDEMVGWHHQLSGHGFVWTPGVGDGQGGLVCCGSWGHSRTCWAAKLNWVSPTITLTIKGTLANFSTPMKGWVDIFISFYWFAKGTHWKYTKYQNLKHFVCHYHVASFLWLEGKFLWISMPSFSIALS